MSWTFSQRASSAPLEEGYGQLNSPSLFSTDANSNFHVLWEDGERIICRAERHADGDLPGVLTVLPAVEDPAPATLDRLAHEYELRDELDRAWAVLPLQLVRDGGRTMLILEDPGGQPLERQLGQPMELGQFLRLAITLSAALRELHARGIIHKDIKPANILVDSAIEKAWLTSARPPRVELAGPLPDALQNQERKMIEMALAECNGRVAGPRGAAAKLGIPRSTLDTKIKQLGIKKHKFISE